MATQTHSTQATSIRSSSNRQKRRTVGDRQSDNSLRPSSADSSNEACTRLVVLVSDGMADGDRLAQEIGRLITPSISEMVLVGLGPQEPGSPASKRLARLASVTQSLPVIQNKQVIDTNSWTEAVRAVTQPGDIIVCQAGEQAHQLVGELSEITQSPIHLLNGLYPSPKAGLGHILNRLLFNLFPLVVVAAFFWLQIQIDGQNSGLLHTLVIAMSVLLELGVIFVWSLFIR